MKNLFLLILVFISLSISQTPELYKNPKQEAYPQIDLSEYKVPETQYWRLMFEPSFRVSVNTDENTEYHDNLHSLSNGSVSPLSFSLYQQGNLKRSEFIRQLNLKGSLVGSSDLSYGARGFNNDDASYSKKSSSGFSYGIDYSEMSRFYNKSKFFFEINGYLGGRQVLPRVEETETRELNTINQREDAVEYSFVEKESQELELDVRIGTAVGRGRIKDLEFYYTALQMLDYFKRSGKLLKAVDSKDVQELAQLMEKLDSKRNFDSRLERIQEIKKIVELLQNRSLLAQALPETVMEVNDFYTYSNVNSFKSGYRVGLGVGGVGTSAMNSSVYKTELLTIDTLDKAAATPSLSQLKSESLQPEYSYESENSQHYWGAYVNLLGIFEKPLGLWGQLSFENEARFGLEYLMESEEYFSFDLMENDSVRTGKYLFLEAKQGIEFFISRVSSFSFTHSLSYVNYFDADFGFRDRPHLSSSYYSTVNESFGGASLINALDQSLGLSWTYYLSERFRLDLYSKLGYSYLYKSVDGSSESLAAYYTLRAKLGYAIF